ncbi:MAG: BrnA antitoxin family protein [Paracoccaceae bacterium]
MNKQGDFQGPDEDDFEVDWSRAVMVDNFLKTPVSLRLDPDIIEFFKSDGPGYQTRINAVLRSYMAARKAAKQP